MSTTIHSIPVIGVDGTPLTATVPSKARKLIKGGQAKGFWNKLDQWCIQLLVETRTAGVDAQLGVDPGAKYDGFAVVCGSENVRYPRLKTVGLSLPRLRLRGAECTAV